MAISRKAKKSKPGLSFKLTEEQLKALKPLIEASGSIKIAGQVSDDTFKVSFIACNAAFLACNAAFRACNAPFE
jgi:hypothetical protein